MAYKKIFLIVLFIAFLGVILVFGSDFLENFSEKSPQAPLDESGSNEVLYIINKGNEDINEYQIVISSDSTVFSLLEELSQRNNFEVSSTLYKDMGVFVESIDGLRNGTEDKYWQYWVNDKLGEVAADKKKVEENDKIEWKFDVPPEF